MAQLGPEWSGEPDELQSAVPQRGWVERLLGVSERSGTISVAVLLGALGAAAFVASLAYGWQQEVIDLTQNVDSNNGGNTFQNSYTIEASPATVESLGTIYVLGGLALLAAVGVAVSWPNQAQKLRVLASGVGVGLLGVVIALTVRMPTVSGGQLGVNVLPQEMLDRITTHTQPGIFFGYGSIVLCLTSIWLAGPPIRRSNRAAAPAYAPVAAAPPSTSDMQPSFPTYAPPPYAYERGTVNGLSVSAAEPFDTSVHPGDAWRRRPDR